MSDIEADKKSANSAALIDRGETVGLMEPLVLSQGSPRRPVLSDLAIELATASAGFRRSLPDGIVRALAADQGVMTSETPKGDLRITFPARLVSRWMPGLFPEQTR